MQQISHLLEAIGSLASRRSTATTDMT